MDALEQIIATRKGETNLLETYHEYVVGLEKEIERLNKLLAVAGDDQIDAWDTAEEKLRAKDAEIAELKRPGRELSDDELVVKANGLFRSKYHALGIEEVKTAEIVYARWAIAESRPAMCGPTAAEIAARYNRERYHGDGGNAHYKGKTTPQFTEWCNSRIKPINEVTKPLENRIAVLQKELSEQTDRAERAEEEVATRIPKPEEAVRWYTNKARSR